MFSLTRQVAIELGVTRNNFPFRVAISRDLETPLSSLSTFSFLTSMPIPWLGAIRPRPVNWLPPLNVFWSWRPRPGRATGGSQPTQHCTVRVGMLSESGTTLWGPCLQCGRASRFPINFPEGKVKEVWLSRDIKLLPEWKRLWWNGHAPIWFSVAI
jgi:hypothetical protein